jgi:hypothetical protein
MERNFLARRRKVVAHADDFSAQSNAERRHLSTRTKSNAISIIITPHGSWHKRLLVK